jgi:hypothetical protein
VLTIRPRLVRRAAMAAGGVACAGALVAVPASAATTMLDLFGKTTSETITNAAGHTITNPNASPEPGDHFVLKQRLYVGSQKHHAKKSTGSVRFTCAVKTTSKYLCSATFDINGSTLLADNLTIKLGKTFTGTINGGTGKYANAHGTFVHTKVGQGMGNFVITLSA